MTVPVSGRIPDSTLSPFQVRQKFSSRSMAGLGCSTDDDWTNCDWDATTTTIDSGGGFFGSFTPPDTTGSSTIDFSAYGSATQPDGTPWPFADLQEKTILSAYQESDGAVVLRYSDGSFATLAPNGSTRRSGGIAPSPSYSPPPLTSAQSSAWPSVVGALINAGVKLGTVEMLPPGTSLLPNGTIVGSGQSLIRPGVITSNSLTSGINALLQNPMFLIGGFGILAVALLAGGRR